MLLAALAANSGCGGNIDALNQFDATSTDPDNHANADADADADADAGGGGYNTVTGGGGGSTTSGTFPDVEELPPEEPPPPVDNPPDVHTIRISGMDDPHVEAPGLFWLTVYAKDDNAIERVEFRTDKDDEPVGVTKAHDGQHVYGVPWELNHTRYDGLTTFTATAFDDKGQSESASIVLSAELLESGYVTPLTGTFAPTVSEVWSDIAVKPDGELVIVGHRTVTLEQIDDDDLEFVRLVVERRSPDGSEIYDANFVDTPSDTDIRGLRVGLRSDEIYVLSDREGVSHIARYASDGEQLDAWSSSQAQYRDLVVANGSVIVTGNTGTLNQTETSVITLWLTSSLSIKHWRKIDGDGADLNSGRAVSVAGDDVLIAGVVELENGNTASLLARYSVDTASEKWIRIVDSEFGEQLADVAAVGDKLVAIGTIKNEGSTSILLRRFYPDGFPEYEHEVLFTDNGHGLCVVAMPGDEFIVAGRTCTLDPKCTTRVHRFQWHAVHPQMLWSDWVGLSSSETPTALAAAPFGFALLSRHGSVNLGEGHHEQSSLWQYYP